MEPEIVEELKGRLGMVIGGRWKLVKILGLGASAGVYRGVDAQGWRVAVKVMHSKFLRSKVVRERFIREQSILDQVQHKHTLRIYETSQTLDGLPYIVMELLEGQTLARIMSKRGEVPLEIERVVAYMVPVLEALELCHGKQILHRDLKPANIFLTHEGVIKLLDFGVARYHQDGKNLTRDGATLGTPAFMSPEQASGRMDRLDARSDLFSVGATMHYLLSGQYIHDEETAQLTYLKAATAPAPSLARNAPHLPPEVVRFVDRAVAWNPGERWQGAEQMRGELRGVIEALRLKSARPRQETMKGVGAIASAPPASPAPSGAHPASPSGVPQRGALPAHRAFFAALERALFTLHEEGAEGANGREVISDLERRMRALQGEGTPLVLEVLPFGMRPRGVDEPQAWWTPASPLDVVCYTLLGSGVRAVRLLPRLERGDLAQLLSLVLRPLQGTLAREDDLATAIWDRQLVGVELELSGALGQIQAEHYRAMDQAFAAQLDAVGETVRSEIALEHERLRLFDSLQGRHPRAIPLKDEELWLSARRQNILQEEGSLGGLDAQDLVTLRAQHRKQRQSWAQRLGTVLGEVVSQAHELGDEAIWLEPLGEVAARLVSSGRVEELLELLEVMMRRVPSASARQQLVARCISPEGLTDLFRELGVLPRYPADAIQRELSAKTLSVLSLIIEALGQGALPQVLDALVSPTLTAERLRAPLLTMARAHLRGAEGALTRVIHRLPAPVIEGLMPGLTQSEGGRAVLARGLAHQEAEVRLTLCEALLPRIRSEETRAVYDVLVALSWSERAEIRRQALELVVHHQFFPFSNAFAARFTHPDFHLLAIEERRRNFELLRALSAPLAEKVSVELLTPSEPLRGQEIIATRLLAIEDLARNGFTQEAFAALDASRRHHPWVSREVREAAQRSFSRFCERLGIQEGRS